MDTRHNALALIIILLSWAGMHSENTAVTKMLKEKYATAYSFDYPKASGLKGNYYVIYKYIDQQTKTGICDGQGNEIFPVKYDYAFFAYRYWTLSTGNSVEIYSPDRKLIHTVNGYPRVDAYNADARRIVVSTKDPKQYGVVDLDGKEILPVKYAYVHDMTVQKNDYDDPLPFFYIGVKSGDKMLYGLTDMDGHILLQPEYESISRISWAKELKLEKNGKAGRASYDGKLLVPADKYIKVSDAAANGGYRTAHVDESTVCVIDSSGKELIRLPYSDVDASDVIKDEPFIKIYKDKKVGFYSKTAGEVIAPEYDDAVCSKANGVPRMFLVRQGKNVGVLGLDGKVIVPLKYPMLESDGKGIYVGVNYSAPIDKGMYFLGEIPAGSQWGYYDLKGNEILKPEYAYVKESEGLLLVNRGGSVSAFKYVMDKKNVTGGHWGFIDMDGNEIIPVEYEALSAFSGGVANGVKDGVASAIPHPLQGTNLKIANGGASSFNSPVDHNIPKASKSDPELFAFIFAVENYNNYEGADYALRDGETFRQYCEQALGIPVKNVKMFADATYANIKSNLKKISEIADVYDGEAKFLVYFAGLGTVDGTSGTPYFLPGDAVPSAVAQTAVDIRAFTTELEQLPAKWSVVLVDAPVNGNNRLGKPLGEGRGVRLAPKPVEPKGAVLVCMAASGDSDAAVDPATGHGLLTLEFLDNLRLNPAPQPIAERLEAVSQRIRKRTLEAGGNIQTPEIKIGSHPSVTSAKL